MQVSHTINNNSHYSLLFLLVVSIRPRITTSCVLVLLTKSIFYSIDTTIISGFSAKLILSSVARLNFKKYF